MRCAFPPPVWSGSHRDGQAAVRPKPIGTPSSTPGTRGATRAAAVNQSATRSREPVLTAHGQTHLPLRLPVLRRRHPEMGRPLRDLRRVEHDRRGNRSPPAPAPPARHSPGSRVEFVGLAGSADAAAARRHRHRRTGPRAGRRPGAGLGRAGRRRSRHRQVHAAAAGRRARWHAPAGGCCTCRARNRSSRCACAPAGWGWRTRRWNSPPRSTCATSPPAWSRRRTPHWW